MRRPLDAFRTLRSTWFKSAALALVGLVAVHAPLGATPALVMDVATGDVLYQQDATRPWFPASTTKLMTVYVALMAVRDHQISLDTPLVVSARAHAMPPSKMGFPVGTQVTLDNALKMLMVRSANDLAITVAEGIAGSVEAFADDMNQAAAQLGMRDSHFANPNGLPNPTHVSSARDMAILARALYLTFPQQVGLFDLGALSLGSEIIVNHNNLLGRYPGADGMKTGFTCAAGFNVVASAYRDGRRLVTVIFGAPNVATRTAKAAALFDRGFAGIDRPIGSIVALPSSGMSGAPDMHDQVCRAARKGLIAQFDDEVTQLDAPLMPASGALGGLAGLNPERAFLFNTTNVAQGEPTAMTINRMPAPGYEPVPVHIGAEAGYTGVVAQARAPHSPIGTDVQPVSAEAYAATPVGPIHGIAGPLGIDSNALPLRGRRIKAARTRGGHSTLKAAAEAPTTKVMEGAEGSDETPAAKGTTKAETANKARKTAKAVPKKETAPKPHVAAPKVDKGHKPAVAEKPAPPKKAAKSEKAKPGSKTGEAKKPKSESGA